MTVSQDRTLGAHLSRKLLPLILLTACLSQQAIAQTIRGDAASVEFDTALEVASSLPRLYSLLISLNGDLVVEEYFNGKGPSTIANVKSVSKSVISALIGIAIEAGHINGVEQPIADFFGDELAESDRMKSGIRVEDLLTMQSGLETTSNRNYGSWVMSRDWVGFALDQPVEYPPGSLMVYSTGNTHLLSAILTRATGRSTWAFARDTLGEPLGFSLAQWPRDPQGIFFGGNDMEFTPRQMVAIGELYLNEGRADNRQVIPAEWIESSLEPRAVSTRESGRYYGYGWWIREMAGHMTPYAWGYGGQFIVL
ncbi:MAG: serine hydrolase domain-containing protein, partial [Gammaproteobacteria bacterium]